MSIHLTSRSLSVLNGLVSQLKPGFGRVGSTRLYSYI
jgi:hypothetical protein